MINKTITLTTIKGDLKSSKFRPSGTKSENTFINHLESKMDNRADISTNKKVSPIN